MTSLAAAQIDDSTGVSAPSSNTTEVVLNFSTTSTEIAENSFLGSVVDTEAMRPAPLQLTRQNSQSYGTPLSDQDVYAPGGLTWISQPRLELVIGGDELAAARRPVPAFATQNPRSRCCPWFFK